MASTLMKYVADKLRDDVSVAKEIRRVKDIPPIGQAPVGSGAPTHFSKVSDKLLKCFRTNIIITWKGIIITAYSPAGTSDPLIQSSTAPRRFAIPCVVFPKLQIEIVECQPSLACLPRWE